MVTFSLWSALLGWLLTVPTSWPRSCLPAPPEWALRPLETLVRMWSTLWQNFNLKTKKVKHINPGNLQTGNTVTTSAPRLYSCSGKWSEFNLIFPAVTIPRVNMHCVTIPDQLMTRVPSMNQVTQIKHENETRALSDLLHRFVIHQPWNEKRAPFFRFLGTQL